MPIHGTSRSAVAARPTPNEKGTVEPAAGTRLSAGSRVERPGIRRKFRAKELRLRDAPPGDAPPPDPFATIRPQRFRGPRGKASRVRTLHGKSPSGRRPRPGRSQGPEAQLQ